MKRLLCMLCALCLLAPCALAESAGMVAQAKPLSGEQYYPAGADAQSAAYVFRYAYPQFQGQAGGLSQINAYYASLMQDMVNTVMPQTVADMDSLPAQGAPTGYTQIDYRIIATTDDYLSVLLSTRQFGGNSETESLTGNVFALSGVYQGQALSLSQLTGLEQQDGANGNSYASELVYGLVWQIIQQEQANQQRDYLPGITQSDLQGVFTPETDFYLDQDGNIVFYIQSGEIASDVEGILTYPFSVAELLSAVQK